uniref:AA_permease domain-containing protein n=1 Tax=Rhabditophanes sp. KR3021 TaxID=114890 RepID=A0AC35U6R2_9BILA
MGSGDDNPLPVDNLEPVDSLFSANNTIDSKSLPWFQRNFIVNQEKVLFGTWDGVFPTVIVNIFGIIIFLRMGWIVGTAGIANSVLLLIICTTLSFITVLSAIGICERCQIKNGGIYFLVSHVLGGRIGGAVGLIYVFGQAVGTSLVAVGFGESVARFFNSSNVYLIKFIAVSIILCLTVINSAGVRWIIRIQMVLLFFLFIAIVDFFLGAMHGHNYEMGLGSLNSKTFEANKDPHYDTFNCTSVGYNVVLPGNESFFTVFGVFFANFLGVLAGTNMSSDLRDPKRNIALGEISAITVSSLTCLVFILCLGASVDRPYLLCDIMINERVSLTKFIFLTGLYLSSLSSIIGSLIGTPRVLQGLAAEGIIPTLAPLSQGVGANNNPVRAGLVMMGVAVAFVLFGSLNQLAVMSAMPFLITYAFVNYSYASLAMSYDLQEIHALESKTTPGYGAVESGNLNELFKNGDANTIGNTGSNGYSTFSSRYISLIGAMINILIIFLIDFWLAIVQLLIFIALHAYIGMVSRCSSPGISQFSIYSLFHTIFASDSFVNSENTGFVINSEQLPSHSIEDSVLTERNTDYAERKNYHHNESIDN